MNRNLFNIFAVLLLGICVSCGTIAKELPPTGNLRQSPADLSNVSFADQTRAIVDDAERLIEKNARNGAVLDQKWYGLKRLGEHQELLLGAEKVIFYGGLEADVRSHIKNQYLAITPVDKDQDPGEIRLFKGSHSNGKWDFIVIGQNGREVALKTVIRFLYMAKFADEEIKRKYQRQLQSFSKSLRVFMSSLSPRAEYVNFFKNHGIRNPAAVAIGFMGDSSLLMGEMGFEKPQTISDESLRAIWYPNLNGKAVLLISINGNRIFASRCGDLMEAIYDISPDTRPQVTFLGSAGAIDAPELVGKIVAPSSVVNGDPFPGFKTQGAPPYLIRNEAADLVALHTIHASVESVVVETTEWAKHSDLRRVKTVDQEIYHLIDAIHSSPRGAETKLYAAVLVTDNVSTKTSDSGPTLEDAETLIAHTAQLRRDFLLKVFRKQGVLKDSKQPEPIPEPERRKTGTSDR